MDSPDINIRKATREDCFDVGRRLRRDDYIELRHVFGSEEDPGWVLDSERMANADETFTLIINGEIIGIGGCVQTRPGVGCPWFMGTDSARKYMFTFHAVAIQLVDYWRSQYALLSNYVWDGSRAKKWLQRLGFAMMPEISHVTESGGEFRRFVMSGEAEECAPSPERCSDSKQLAQ